MNQPIVSQTTLHADKAVHSARGATPPAVIHRPPGQSAGLVIQYF